MSITGGGGGHVWSGSYLKRKELKRGEIGKRSEIMFLRSFLFYMHELHSFYYFIFSVIVYSFSPQKEQIQVFTAYEFYFIAFYIVLCRCFLFAYIFFDTYFWHITKTIIKQHQLFSLLRSLTGKSLLFFTRRTLTVIAKGVILVVMSCLYRTMMNSNVVASVQRRHICCIKLLLLFGFFLWGMFSGKGRQLLLTLNEVDLSGQVAQRASFTHIFCCYNKFYLTMVP